MQMMPKATNYLPPLDERMAASYQLVDLIISKIERLLCVTKFLIDLELVISTASVCFIEQYSSLNSTRVIFN